MKKIVYILAISIMAVMTACGSGTSNSSAERAVASGEPIELAAGDTLELGDNLAKPVIVDFWAEWCPPCREFAPVFQEVAKMYKGKVMFVSVDVDKCPEIARQYGVASVPTVLTVSKDGVINRTIGLMTRDEFIASVDAVL